MATAARIEEMRLAATRAQLRRGALYQPGSAGAQRRPHVAAALGRVARAVFRRGTTRAFIPSDEPDGTSRLPPGRSEDRRRVGSQPPVEVARAAPPLVRRWHRRCPRSHRAPMRPPTVRLPLHCGTPLPSRRAGRELVDDLAPSHCGQRSKSRDASRALGSSRLRNPSCHDSRPLHRRGPVSVVTAGYDCFRRSVTARGVRALRRLYALSTGTAKRSQDVPALKLLIGSCAGASMAKPDRHDPAHGRTADPPRRHELTEGGEPSALDGASDHETPNSHPRGRPVACATVTRFFSQMNLERFLPATCCSRSSSTCVRTRRTCSRANCPAPTATRTRAGSPEPRSSRRTRRSRPHRAHPPKTSQRTARAQAPRSRAR